MSGYGSGGHDDDERVHHVLSQETIDRAMADDAARRQPQQQQHASSHSHSSGSHSHSQGHSQGHSSSTGPIVPGIVRRDTTTRRDPLTGDMMEEYSGSDPNGPAMRAHYDWDANQQTHSNSSHTSNTSRSNEPRPGEVKRTNTTISYNSSGDRIEDHDGEGSLEVRAMYNEDDDTSNTYRPSGPARGHSDGGNRGHY